VYTAYSVARLQINYTQDWSKHAEKWQSLIFYTLKKLFPIIQNNIGKKKYCLYVLRNYEKTNYYKVQLNKNNTQNCNIYTNL